MGWKKHTQTLTGDAGLASVGKDAVKRVNRCVSSQQATRVQSYRFFLFSFLVVAATGGPATSSVRGEP